MPVSPARRGRDLLTGPLSRAGSLGVMAAQKSPLRRHNAFLVSQSVGSLTSSPSIRDQVAPCCRSARVFDLKPCHSTTQHSLVPVPCPRTHPDAAGYQTFPQLTDGVPNA